MFGQKDGTSRDPFNDISTVDVIFGPGRHRSTNFDFRKIRINCMHMHIIVNIIVINVHKHCNV